MNIMKVDLSTSTIPGIISYEVIELFCHQAANLIPAGYNLDKPSE